MLLPRPNCKTAFSCIEVLKTHEPFEDKEYQLAKISASDENVFNALRVVQRPSCPETVVIYNTMSDRERSNFLKSNPSYFTSHEEGGRYLGKLRESISTTERNKEWLERMLEIFISKGDQADAAKVRVRLTEFDDGTDTKSAGSRNSSRILGKHSEEGDLCGANVQQRTPRGDTHPAISASDIAWDE